MTQDFIEEKELDQLKVKMGSFTILKPRENNKL